MNFKGSKKIAVHKKILKSIIIHCYKKIKNRIPSALHTSVKYKYYIYNTHFMGEGGVAF